MNRFRILCFMALFFLFSNVISSADVDRVVLVSATQPSVTKTSTDLSVVSYNIFNSKKKKQILENIQSADPDIVLLQEVDLSSAREYAQKLKMAYEFGEYKPKYYFGMAILAKGKIERVKHFQMANERNFALACTVANRGEKVLVVCMHLKSLPRPVSTGVFKVMKPHMEQAKRIIEEVKKHKLPAIVGGDCNAFSFSPEYMVFTSGEAGFKDTATSSKAATQPTIFVGDLGYRIDYLFTRGPWQVKSYNVSPKPGSDHKMIHSRLQLLQNSHSDSK